MPSVPKYGLIRRIHSLEFVYFMQVQSVKMQGETSRTNYKNGHQLSGESSSYSKDETVNRGLVLVQASY